MTKNETGSRTPAEILSIALDGEPFSPDAYLDYLEEKVRDVYGE